MSTLLLDAGVWLAARDADDRHHEPACRLIEAGPDARPLAALDLTLYEVANVATRSWRSPDRARIVARLVRAACTDTIAPVDDALIERAIALADEHGLSVYDAAYVAAARERAWTLVSTDHADLVGPGHAIAPEDAIAQELDD